MGEIAFIAFLIIINILVYLSSNVPIKWKAWLHVRVFNEISPSGYFFDEEYRKAIDHFRKKRGF